MKVARVGGVIYAIDCRDERVIFAENIVASIAVTWLIELALEKRQDWLRLVGLHFEVHSRAIFRPKPNDTAIVIDDERSLLLGRSPTITDKDRVCPGAILRWRAEVHLRRSDRATDERLIRRIAKFAECV